MNPHVLEVSDLSINFGGLRAVDGVTFAAERNRITTVIGPNGAGKSTLFNLVSGALAPKRGSVRLNGRNVTGAPPYRMQAAGLARSPPCWSSSASPTRRNISRARSRMASSGAWRSRWRSRRSPRSSSSTSRRRA